MRVLRLAALPLAGGCLVVAAVQVGWRHLFGWRITEFTDALDFYMADQLRAFEQMLAEGA